MKLWNVSYCSENFHQIIEADNADAAKIRFLNNTREHGYQNSESEVVVKPQD